MNIYILNTLDVGIDLMEMCRNKIQFKGVIGLSNRNKTDAISGYRYMKDYCHNRGLEFVEVSDYSLQNGVDKSTLSKLDIDVLIVSGWQRLIPDWLIEQCNEVAVGVHGSAWGISEGRGRSPQNWALMLGKKSFSVSLFQVSPGIDDGNIIDTAEFCLTAWDDIRTSYYKVTWLTHTMLIDMIKFKKWRSAKPQYSDNARYLPQRKPEDGTIDWHRTPLEIFNFIRALSRPYPGACTFLEGVKFTIWRARPFIMGDEVKSNFDKTADIGTIMAVFANGDFLIQAKGGLLLVEDYLTNAELKLKVGMRFCSANFSQQMDNIVSRHTAKYPDLPLQPELESHTSFTEN